MTTVTRPSLLGHPFLSRDPGGSTETLTRKGYQRITINVIFSFQEGCTSTQKDVWVLAPAKKVFHRYMMLISLDYSPQLVHTLTFIHSLPALVI